jgi:PHP family Zn ribbon phosphoesterase
LHLIPLAEIIALAMGCKSAMTVGVQKLYRELTAEKTEIDVLIQADLKELRAEPRVIKAISDFRQGRIEVSPGGGGWYGKVRLADDASMQRSLFDF